MDLFRKRRNPKNYVRLTKTGLRAHGFSESSERYRLKGTPETISKRQYQELQLNKGRKRSQKKITLEQRAQEFESKIRQYSPGARAAAKGRKIRAGLDKHEDDRVRDLEPHLKKTLSHAAFERQRGKRLTHKEHAQLGEVIFALGGDDEARALVLDFIGSPQEYARAA